MVIFHGPETGKRMDGGACVKGGIKVYQ